MSHDKDKDKKRKAREKEKAREKDKDKGSHAVGSEEKPGERGGKFSIFTLLTAVAGVLLVVAFVQPIVTIDHLDLLNEIKLMSDNQYAIERNDEKIAAGDAASEELRKENERLRSEIRERSDIIKDHIYSHLDHGDLPGFESRINVDMIDETVRYDDWFALVFNMSGVVSVRRDMLDSLTPEDKRELLHSVFEGSTTPTGLKIFKTSNLFLRHEKAFIATEEVKQTVSTVRWMVVAFAVLGIVAVAFAFISRFGRMNGLFLIVMFLPASAFLLTAFIALIPLGAMPGMDGVIEKLGGGGESEPIGSNHDHVHDDDDDDGTASDLMNAADNGGSDVANTANMSSDDAANAAAAGAADAAGPVRVDDLGIPTPTPGGGLWFLLCGSGLLLLIIVIEPLAVLFTGVSMRTFGRALLCYGAYIGFVIAIGSVVAVPAKDMLQSVGLKVPLIQSIGEAANNAASGNADNVDDASGNESTPINDANAPE